MLAWNQYSSWRPHDRPALSRFSVSFLVPRANAELVFQFHFDGLFSCSPININLKVSINPQPSQPYQNFAIIQPSKYSLMDHLIKRTKSMFSIVVRQSFGSLRNPFHASTLRCRRTLRLVMARKTVLLYVSSKSPKTKLLDFKWSFAILFSDLMLMQLYK
jgi:hypothetical protein